MPKAAVPIDVTSFSATDFEEAFWCAHTTQSMIRQRVDVYSVHLMVARRSHAILAVAKSMVGASTVSFCGGT